MGDSLFDDIMVGAVVAKHAFRGASKLYAKAKKVAGSEKGQQLKAELRAKANEAIGLAGDKAKELGLEEKTKSILGYAKEYAKELILNDSPGMSPEAEVIVYGPGGYVERITALEDRLAEETIKHNNRLEELKELLANAPEYIEAGENGFSLEDLPVTANVYEQQIRDEEENFEALNASIQKELQDLKDEMDEGLFYDQQRQRELQQGGDAYEQERRREENERDWAIFLGKNPDKYR